MAAAALVVHVDVDVAVALAVLREDLVVVGRLGELGDDVPGVEESRNLVAVTVSLGEGWEETKGRRNA